MSIKTKITAILSKYGLSLEDEPQAEMVSKQLEDGTTVHSDGDFEPGSAVFVINDEGEHIPLPDGEYKTAEGEVLQIAEGMVSDESTTEESTEEVAEEPAEEVDTSKEEEEEEEMYKDEDKEEEEMAEVFAQALKKVDRELKKEVILLREKVRQLETKLSRTAEAPVRRSAATNKKQMTANLTEQQKKTFEIFNTYA